MVNSGHAIHSGPDHSLPDQRREWDLNPRRVSPEGFSRASSLVGGIG
jgi:hypothetical protein